MSGSGHPSRHGYVRCLWCECWRRKAETTQAGVGGGEHICIDIGWCQKPSKSPETARPATFGTNTGWDANGAPIEQGGAL